MGADRYRSSVRDSQIGSVCERVTRLSGRDIWVVKYVPEANTQETSARRSDGTSGKSPRDTILVGVDGSPQSFGALTTAIDLAGKFDKKVEAISVYDPYLHYSVFNGIVKVLTEKAAQVFRFEEQNQLHEEIIDTAVWLRSTSPISRLHSTMASASAVIELTRAHFLTARHSRRSSTTCGRSTPGC